MSKATTDGTQAVPVESWNPVDGLATATVCPPTGDRLDAITDRRRAVLRLVAAGLADKQIASRLGITTAGVKKHLHVLMIRHTAQNRAALVSIAIRRHWIDADDDPT